MAADNVVSIDIMVRDGGTLAVLDTAGAKLKTLEAGAAGVGGAVKEAGASFGAIGSGAQAMGEANEKATGLYRSMLMVSGEGREMGLNLGYSLRHFIAESPAAMAVLRSMEGLFLGIAAIDIAGQAIEGLHAFYEKFIDVEHAVDEYRKKAGEAAETKLFETSSIETTSALLQQVKGELDAIEAKKDNRLGQAVMTAIFGPGAPVAAWGLQKAGFHSPMFTGQDAEVEVKDLQNQATAQQRLRDQVHEEAVQQIEERQRFNSVALEGLAKIAAAQQTANEKAAENFRFTQQNEQALHDTAAQIRAVQEKKRVSPDLLVNVPAVDPNAGWQKYVDESTEANRQAQAERLASARQEIEEETRMRNEAIEAGMRGEALYDHQRSDAIDAVTRKYQRGEISRQTMLKETEDLDMKFHNAKMVRLEDEQYATKKIQEEAQQSGLTGIPKIQAETQSRISELTENPANAGLSSDDIQKRRAAYQLQGNQQILEAQQQFQQKIEQITERSADQMTQGLAKVAADEKQSLAELDRAYTEFYGADEAKWQGYQDAKTSIQQAADHERQKLSEDVDRQISQTEAEAARSLLPPWQATQQKILDDYQQRIEKIREDVEQHVVTEEQAARQVQAAWDVANAEMERATQQERDKLAGQLASFFDNPAKYMQQRAKQVMFDIMANWMQQVEQASPQLQSMIGGMFGLNPVGTGSPQHAFGQMFGMHGTTHGADQSGLTSASSTLITAGSTLSSSGTMLASSAAALTQAATAWEAALYRGGGSTGAGGSDFTGWTGESGGSGILSGAGGSAMPGMFGSGGGSAFGGSGAGAGSTGALSETLGLPSQLASQIPGASAANSTLGLLNGVSQLFSSSSSSGAQLLNASGGLQPSDLPPTSSSGVMGTVPDTSGGYGATDDSGTAGPGLMGGLGAIVSGGMGVYGGLSSAWNSSNFGSGLLGAATTALSGAELGMAFGGPIGAAIGAGAGFAAGMVADVFGDHGRSKAQHYNTYTVVPTLMQAMDGFGGGEGDYDQASLTINNLQIQAQKQTAQWGSGATAYYHSVIVPEITNAQNQVNREGAAGRANVQMTGAQFHTGGWVDDFLDLATSYNEGFIHAEAGEYMMRSGAAAMNAPWLEAMNRGLDMTSAVGALMPRSGGSTIPRETGAAANLAYSVGGTIGGPAPSSAGHVHLHVHALDSRDVGRWLRGGGAMQIQTELNRNVARYSGKALGP